MMSVTQCIRSGVGVDFHTYTRGAKALCVMERELGNETEICPALL